jgi:DNA-binding beta-propeller fold protein YncE
MEGFTMPLPRTKSFYVMITDQDANSTAINTYTVEEMFDTIRGPASTPTALGLFTNPVGLTIDTNSKTLFIADGSYIHMLDGTTIAPLSSSPFAVAGASNLAGIVMDENKQLLYVADGGTNNLYVLTWDSTNKKLKLFIAIPLLPPPMQPGEPGYPAPWASPTAAGIALDTINHLLYVANGGLYVYVYYTGVWLPTNPGYVDLSDTDFSGEGCYSIAIDSARQLLYAGNGIANNTLLLQKNLRANGLANAVDVSFDSQGGCGRGVMGLGVDDASGNIFVSTGYGFQSNSGGDLLIYPPVWGQDPQNPQTPLHQITNIGPYPMALAIPSGGEFVWPPIKRIPWPIPIKL